MEIIKSEKKKANKDHKCGFCCGAIPKNSIYGVNTVKDGDLYRFKYHLSCEAIAYKLDMDNAYSGEGITSSSFQEYIIDAYIEMAGKETDLPDFDVMLAEVKKHYKCE